MDDIPTVVWILLGISTLAMIAVLVDLAIREVRDLSKWVWALIIVLLSFPIGAIVYFVVGRVPPAETRAQRAPQTRTAPGAPPGAGIPAEAGRIEIREPETGADRAAPAAAGGPA